MLARRPPSEVMVGAVLALITLWAMTACRGGAPISTDDGGLPRIGLATPAAVPSSYNESPTEVTTTTGMVPEAADALPAMPTALPADDSAVDRFAELRSSIQQVLAGVPGEWGVGVRDLATGDTLLINAHGQYPAASLYKLLLLYEAYVQAEEGKLSLDETTTMIEADYAEALAWDEELQVGERVSVKGLLRVMIIQSSNAGAHALERLMTGTTANDAARRLGFNDTHVPLAGDSEPYSDWRAEESATSVGDILAFYTMLYRHELVSAEASEAMLALLKEQQINDRIPALLSPDTEVAHKTGNLPGVVNDAGIVFGPKGDVVLTVLSQDADHDTGTEAIASIGQLVYDWRDR